MPSWLVPLSQTAVTGIAVTAQARQAQCCWSYLKTKGLAIFVETPLFTNNLKQGWQEVELICLCASRSGYKDCVMLQQSICRSGLAVGTSLSLRRWSRGAQSAGSPLQASGTAGVAHAAAVHADKPPAKQLLGNTEHFSSKSKQLNANGVLLNQTLPSIIGKQLLAYHLQAATSRSTSASLWCSFRMELFHEHTGHF